MMDQASPVFAVDLVGGEGVVKHQDLVGILEPWSGVLTVFQLHGRIQQGEIAADDESVRTVCGKNQKVHGSRAGAAGAVLASPV